MKEKEILEKIVKLGKLISFLLLAILIVLTVGVSKIYSNSNNTKTEQESTEYNTDYDVSMFKEITAKDIKKETKKELKVIYIGRESCSWCAAFLPNLWDAQDNYGFKTLYIDIAKIIDFNTGEMLNKNDYDTLSNITGEGYENYMEENLGATPMILIMKDNKIINAQTGYSDYSTFEKVLTDAGIK